MAAFNFPNSPSTNDLHTENSVTWKWNGSVWKRQGVAGAQGAQGVQGAAGAQGAQGAQGHQGVQGTAGSNANADFIIEGNTKAEVVDSGSDGHFKIETEGSERFRLESTGKAHFWTGNNDYTNPDIGGSTSGVSIGKNVSGQIYACVDDSSGDYYKNWTMNLCRRNNAGDGPQLALDRSGWVKASIAGLQGGNTASSGPGQFAIYTHNYASGSHVQTERVRIGATGKVGIATDNPYAPLSLRTAAETSSSGNFADNGILLHAPGATDEHVIPISASFVTHAYLPRCGIGFISHPTADPVQGYAGEIGFYTHDAADGSGLSPSNERVRITRGGNVGIGDNSPGQKLSVKNAAACIVQSQSTNSNTSAIFQCVGKNSSGTSRTAKFCYDNADEVRIITDSAIPIKIMNSNAERFRITASGTAVFGGNSAAPIVDNGELYYRGNSTQTFESLPQSFYLYGDSLGSNTANAGTGMVFGGKYDTSGNYTTFAGIHGIKENTTSGQYGGALVFGIRKDGGGVWERLRITTEGVNITCGRANAPKASHAILNLGYDSGETRGIDIYGGWSTGESKSINFPHGTNTADLVGSFDCKHNGGSNGSSFRWGRLYHLGNSSTYPMTLDSINTTTARLNLAGASPHINGHNYIESADFHYGGNGIVAGRDIQLSTRYNTNTSLISAANTGTGSGTRITFNKAVYVLVCMSQDADGNTDSGYWSVELRRSGSIEGLHLMRKTNEWDMFTFQQAISVPANGYLHIRFKDTSGWTSMDQGSWSHYTFLVWQNV